LKNPAFLRGPFPTRDEQLSLHCAKNESSLSLVFGLAREIKSFESPLLRAISDAIQVLLDNPQEISPSAIEKIRLLINSHPHKIEIWKGLYLSNGNGMIEEGWAETHFHEFLPDLKSIINLRRVAVENEEDSFISEHS
jgi:hypothetical protein